MLKNILDLILTYYSMAFSEDGLLIAAVTYSRIIIVFDSYNGDLKTSRKYSAESSTNEYRSIIISSGTSSPPIAYI